jgi:hypothetical protein
MIAAHEHALRDAVATRCVTGAVLTPWQDGDDALYLAEHCDQMGLF